MFSNYKLEDAEVEYEAASNDNNVINYNGIKITDEEKIKIKRSL